MTNLRARLYPEGPWPEKGDPIIEMSTGRCGVITGNEGATLIGVRWPGVQTTTVEVFPNPRFLTDTKQIADHLMSHALQLALINS